LFLTLKPYAPPQKNQLEELTGFQVRVASIAGANSEKAQFMSECLNKSSSARAARPFWQYSSGPRGQVLQITCFTGTKVQILTQTALQEASAPLTVPDYLLYWYKSTNTDADSAAGSVGAAHCARLLALLVQKYKY
jgi:hypothetical protein